MDDELATSKTTSGHDDDYMEEEGEGKESVRAGVRVLDEDTDGEEGDEDSGGTQLTRDNMLKDVTAESMEKVNKDLKEQVKNIGCGSALSSKTDIQKTEKTIPPPAVPASSPELHGTNVKRFPQHYYQIRANRMRANNEVTLGGVGYGRKCGCGASQARQWLQHSS
jgi:hypothetical protein